MQRLPDVSFADGLGDSKVHDLQLQRLFVDDEDVVGFQVAMNHADLVGSVERVAYLLEVSDDLAIRPLTTIPQLDTQVLPLQQLHHVVGASLEFAKVEDLDHVRVRQRRGDLGFAQETFGHLQVAVEGGLEELDCNFAA